MSIFEEVHDRKQTKSMKWDMLQMKFQSEDVLPMWVADMDFKAPEAVNQALIKRAEHGIYGYTVIDEDVTSSITDWVKNRHGWAIQADWLNYSPGVINTLHMALQAFTEPGDKIMIQTPVYTPFYNIINVLDREIVKNPLVYQDNYYTIDFEDMENKLASGVKAFILCSPHNPVGRVWTEEELRKMAELCLQYDAMIFSDEIHADLVFKGHKHLPIASLSEEIADQTITCMAPSKTFNLAGLQASYAITSNKQNKQKLEKAFLRQGLNNSLNGMAVTAMEAAYRHGEPWLEELLEVIQSHTAYIKERFADEAPELKVTKSEGTYLVWVDCSELNMDKKELNRFMIDTGRVGLNAGQDYGVEGDPFMRINVACPRATIEEGVNRIIYAVESWRNS
ncbi:MalY/PatB family protein [Oceanobacillus jeddahense]|uniref:cysteine-S-conjugate beta-lyase n=1 Tax=Oceanobacillus jeddahense TaxID=1462527 RepID=A0ABY5JNP1_9BACI|nr:MalY/PatB family protein [Oceanobacillus jeddahense]UUI01918.1 pyridoxal phosphate-dependent aminotransferase [Oceanobacillus jeddahense]